MKTKFTEFISEEYLTEGISGAEWEEIITASYNMMSHKVDLEKAIELGGMAGRWKSKFDEHIDTGHKIVSNSFGKNPKGTMEHYGAGTADLTNGWNKYFISMTGKPAGGSTKTPKTDMYIAKQHISLKKTGGSQLMSGGVSETLATLGYAYDKTPDKVKTAKFDKAWKKLQSDIESQFLKGVSLKDVGTITNLKKDIKSGGRSKLTLMVKKALTDNTAMTQAIRDIFEIKEVKMEVVREAMTGLSKFAKPLPKSTHMMIFSPAGDGHYTPINNSLVTKYASQTKFNISFKTSGTGGSAWTGLKGIFHEDVETNDDLIEKLLDESYEETHQEMLTEGVLSSIKSFIGKLLKKFWDKIVAIIVKSLGLAQSIFGKQMVVNDPKVTY